MDRETAKEWEIDDAEGLRDAIEEAIEAAASDHDGTIGEMVFYPPSANGANITKATLFKIDLGDSDFAFELELR